MKKLKEAYKSFAKSMENPRFRSIVILGMYTIFFALIFLLLNFGGSSTTTTNNNKVDKNINYTNVKNNYKFTAEIEINENDEIKKYEITNDSKLDETNEIVKLYNEDTNSYEVSTKPIMIYDNFFDLTKVISYVNNLEFEYSTKYKDGSQMKNYLVPVSTIDSSRTSDDKIEVNVFELNNKIIKVIIDSTNYDKLRNVKINKIMYVIRYEY